MPFFLLFCFMNDGDPKFETLFLFFSGSRCLRRLWDFPSGQQLYFSPNQFLGGGLELLR